MIEELMRIKLRIARNTGRPSVGLKGGAVSSERLAALKNSTCNGGHSERECGQPDRFRSNDCHYKQGECYDYRTKRLPRCPVAD
jgi:hypothetical protein